MKVLNLYAGLGGNRKKWEGVEVTAVEINPTIACFYSDHYPNDNIVVGDAHQYLLDNYREFDFVWTSPPCPTHSRARFWSAKGNEKIESKYPDMALYQEIIFLQHYFEGKWVVENVDPFYKPLIRESFQIGRHLFWSNFQVLPKKTPEPSFDKDDIISMQRSLGIDISGYRFDGVRREKVLRNCVNPDLGLHIFEESKREGLFQL